MFGLNLRRKSDARSKAEKDNEKNAEETDFVEKTDLEKPVMMESEVIEIPSDDDCKLKTQNFEKVNAAESTVGSKRDLMKRKGKMSTPTKALEPTSLNVLSKFEKIFIDKKSAFVSKGLDKYIEINKDGDQTREPSDSEANDDLAVGKFVPDFDDIDGVLFLSFPNETALKGHIQLESKYDWVKENTLMKICQVQAMKARQQVSGCSRLTDAKIGDEQKHNFRGIPMKLMKYKKHLKSEVEELLDVKPKLINDFLISRSYSKTTDITKIKGWKNKYQIADDLQDSSGVRLPESGKLHWRTEERLLKSLDPVDVKDIGLELKKKRPKLVNYSNKKKTVQKPDKVDLDLDMDDCWEEDNFITEKDVFNEDDYKVFEGKLPYSVRYSSQHKYGARKMFVKRMKLDAEDERILKKLGTIKLASDNVKESKQFSLSKLNTAMAVAAVTALDKKLIAKAKTMSKTTSARSSRNHQIQSRSNRHGDEPDVDEEEEDEITEEVDETQMDSDYEEEDEDSDSDAVTEEKMVLEVRVPEAKSQTYRTRSRANSRSGADKGQQLCDKRDVADNHESGTSSICGTRVCDQPGCRYGCICHLCKLSDSGEEKEADIKPPCDKEYCKLGCICESVDTTQQDVKPHCKKPGCMLECKCPPKQPKPDIPREDGQRKKKKGKGKKKKTPIKKEEVEEVEPVTADEQEDWEPPSKKKRAPSNARFANLPRRETTYRVAKNLDAVSRKAMEVYVSSEMYAEQKIRRRKSDNWSDPHLDEALLQSMSEESTPAPKRAGERTPDTSNVKAITEEKVLEISDESEEETFPPDLDSCARTSLFTSNYNRSQNKVGQSQPLSQDLVIDLVESDNEETGRRKDRGSRARAPDPNAPAQVTASDKLGLNRRIVASEGDLGPKWRTQMVCLKAKKKPDDPSAPKSSEPEIKLLEIISNCPWENDRTNMLSKISQIIARELPANHIQMWGKYVLQFLPKADKPAVIPPELQKKLPKNMFSIRIRVTQSLQDIEAAEVSAAEKSADNEVETGKNKETKVEDMAEVDRKKFMLMQQKKLIDKIKFAERLRDLIIAEEKKGTPTNKFSVSREGIDKALRRYKTQLWKAYTGNNNLSIMQLKKAVQAAKETVTTDKEEHGEESAEEPPCTVSMQSSVNLATLARIQSNQGLKVVCPNASLVNTSPLSHMQSNQFISLSNLQASHTAGAIGGQTLVSNTQSVNASSSLGSFTCTTFANKSSQPLSTVTKVPGPPTQQKMQLLLRPEFVDNSLSTAMGPPCLKLATGFQAPKAKTDTIPTSFCNAAQTENPAQNSFNIPLCNPDGNTQLMCASTAGNPAKPPIQQAPPQLSAGIGFSSSTLTSGVYAMPTLSLQSSVSNKTPISSCSTTFTMSLGTNPLPHLAGSEVLLIPVPDKGQNKWDMKCPPVLSAKVSVLPTSVGVSSDQALSKTQVTSGLHMAGTSLTAVSPLTVFTAKGQNLNGKQLVLQPNKPGSSHLMINTIQPVTSTSPLYSHVKGMRFPISVPHPAVFGAPSVSMNGMGAPRMVNTTAFPPKMVVLPPAASGACNLPAKPWLFYQRSVGGNPVPCVSAPQVLDNICLMPQNNINTVNSLPSTPDVVVEGVSKKRKRKTTTKASEDQTQVLKESTKKGNKKDVSLEEKTSKSDDLVKVKSLKQSNETKASDKPDFEKPSEGNESDTISVLTGQSVESNDISKSQPNPQSEGDEIEKVLKPIEETASGLSQVDLQNTVSGATCSDKIENESTDMEADKENLKDINAKDLPHSDVAPVHDKHLEHVEDSKTLTEDGDMKAEDELKCNSEVIVLQNEVENNETNDCSKSGSDKDQETECLNAFMQEKVSLKEAPKDCHSAEASSVEELQLQKEVEHILHYDSDSNCGTDSLGGSVKSFGSFGEMIDLTEITEQQSNKDHLTSESPTPGCSDTTAASATGDKADNSDREVSEAGVTISAVVPVIVSAVEQSADVLFPNKRKADGGDNPTASKKMKSILPKSVDMAIVLDDSEESDVDIMSVDPLKEQTESSRQKAVKKKTTTPTPTTPTPAGLEQMVNPKTEKQGKRVRQKLQMEKKRRAELRMRFMELEDTVYKYSPFGVRPTWQQERSKAVILQDTQKLMSALEEKADGLQECIQDGNQYQEQLKAELAKHKAYFIDNGLPDTVVNNFLKSVASAMNVFKRKKRQESEMEEEDADPFVELKLDLPGAAGAAVAQEECSSGLEENCDTSSQGMPTIYMDHDESWAAPAEVVKLS